MERIGYVAASGENQGVFFFCLWPDGVSDLEMRDTFSGIVFTPYLHGLRCLGASSYV